MDMIYINGHFYKSEDARISVFDRGLLFGDSVYEVIPVYHGQPFLVARHLHRLESSLKKAGIPAPDVDWPGLFTELIAQNDSDGDIQIYLQITRGNQGIRKHDITAGLEPTVIAFLLHNRYLTLPEKHQGISACIVEDIRWQRCDIKTTSMLGHVLVNDEAVSQGANTAILSRNDFITEGSSSNVFLVDSSGLIKTPPLGTFCLPGITREITIELIQSLRLPFSEEAIPVDALLAAREVWITSTTKEICPVTRINHQIIGEGTGGSVWQHLNNHYQQLVFDLS
ncbi:aminotransferase class IV [Legionella spiritensis]|uniref:aminotransferase class IV n=1 Tax=Legionella spiritensis TaxID=452 RepID=UPI000F721057|nr:aminotransferase class IV [Legionella spiritensis]VEG90169.1 D-alanine transaminase [Legionella spiritensis]